MGRDIELFAQVCVEVKRLEKEFNSIFKEYQLNLSMLAIKNKEIKQEFAKTKKCNTKFLHNYIAFQDLSIKVLCNQKAMLEFSHEHKKTKSCEKVVNIQGYLEITEIISTSVANTMDEIYASGIFNKNKRKGKKNESN